MLDRLTSHALSGGATVTVGYYANGNIHTKSDVGTYAYSGINAGPHAVTGVSGGSLGTQTYAYDANGNMTSGGGRVITWTSFNQAKTIAGAGGHSSEFFFGASDERVRQVSDTATTIYVGGIFEKVTDTGGGTEEKNYIMTPTGRVAVATFGTAVPVGGTVQYFHTDGLGSITAVTDETGAVVKRFAYDSWGKQIDPASGDRITSATNSHVTRGYTDHEMLADLGLVHMNGRIYDPVLGRFLSADPFVDGPYDSQGYNRYSYVGNNPMNRTDPSGYWKLNLRSFWVLTHMPGEATFAPNVYQNYGGSAIFSAAVGAVVTYFTWNPALGAAAAGFVSGFSQSILNQGSIGDAFRSGVIGAGYGVATVYAGYLGGVLGSAAVSGWISENQGGGFGAGFASSFVGSFGGYASTGARAQNWYVGLVISTVAGGTASEIGGGKFANGALSATFSYIAAGRPPRRSAPNSDRVLQSTSQEIGKDGTRYDAKSRPDLAAIAKDPLVAAAIDRAWTASNPSSPDPTQRKEVGFWIYRQNEPGDLRLWPFQKGGTTNNEMTPGPTPKIHGGTVVAWFHTHLLPTFLSS